jgi:hypothetical protein
MSLFYGIALICLGVTLAGVTMAGTRKPNPSKYFDGFVYISLFVIVIISMPLLGINFVANYISSLSNEPVSLAGPLLSAAVIVGTILFMKPIKKRLAQYNQIKDTK